MGPRARWCLAVGLAAACVACAPGPRFGSLEFGARSFTLETRGEVFELRNGLQVALLPDGRTNLVRVDVRYRVGGADDPLRRAGMAHLIEHLTFELRPTPGGAPLGVALVDASLVHNASTSHDATHYYEIALASRLTELLELEAQRMNPRCDQLSEAVFLRERDVVLEEEAERSRVVGDRGEAQAAAVWGSAHPYARPVGSREIADVTLAEVCAFLDDHHAPDRATLVVTGDFDPAAVRTLVESRFGASTRHSRKARTQIELPAFHGRRTTIEVEEESERSRRRLGVLVSFPASIPRDGDAVQAVQEVGAAYLEGYLAARSSRWNSRVWFSGGDRARMLHVELDVGGANDVDDALDTIYAAAEQLGRRPLRGFEVDRSKRRNRWLRAIDGFSSRGEIAARRLAYVAPEAMFDGYLRALDGYDLGAIEGWARSTVKRTRSQVVVMRRIPPRSPVSSPVASAPFVHDLPTARLPVEPAEAERPLALELSPPHRTVEEVALPNGLRVLLAPLPGALTVDARLVFPIGDAGAPTEASRARLAAYSLHDDLSPHHEPYDLRRIDWVFGLGTLMDQRVTERTTTFSAEGAALFADWHVWRLFWRIEAGIYPDRRPRKPDRQARREMDELLAKLRASASHARLVSERVFGPGHFILDRFDLDGGSSRDELESFRDRHYGPRGATLIISGGFDPDQMRRHVAELFGSWHARPREAPPAALPVTAATAPSWAALVDRDAVQVRATIALGALPETPALRDQAARRVLVAMLDDRLRAVRERQGASYGVRTAYVRRGHHAALVIEGWLDPHRAGRALVAMLDVVASFEKNDDALATDFVRARRRMVARALADSGAPEDLGDALEVVVSRGLPVTALDGAAAEIAAVTLADVVAAAKRDLAPERRVVVVSGPGDSAQTALVAAGITP